MAVIFTQYRTGNTGIGRVDIPLYGLIILHNNYKNWSFAARHENISISSKKMRVCSVYYGVMYCYHCLQQETTNTQNLTTTKTSKHYNWKIGRRLTDMYIVRYSILLMTHVQDP